MHPNNHHHHHHHVNNHIDIVEEEPVLMNIQNAREKAKNPLNSHPLKISKIEADQRGGGGHENEETSPRNESPGFLAGISRALGHVNRSHQKLSPYSPRFQQHGQEMREASTPMPSEETQGTEKGTANLPFLGKISWSVVLEASKKWLRDPMNLALLLWIIGVAVSGAILFMVLTGMLNRALPKKSDRDIWFEISNQILNALFTLMCVYQHPRRFYHLVLLIRWTPDDIEKLRKLYCKNGTQKPHERTHMMIVIALLHLNCFAQYALCGLNWGFRRPERPAVGVGITVAVAITAPAVAGIYSIISPLGKEYHSEDDLEAPLSPLSGQLSVKSLQKKYSFVRRDVGTIPVSNPKWIGGLFDLWDDIPLAYSSLFCSFCVFGWNMERLGFGNMYVHIATFILLCLAPFFIFCLAAVNIDNEFAREGLGITGILLCVFGLLYGGFWRMRMRKTFYLPANDFCCGKPTVTDCASWLCCCVCSLAQEVRTASFYKIEEDKLYIRNPQDHSQTLSSQCMSPLPHEEGSTTPFRSIQSSPTRNGDFSPELRKHNVYSVQKFNGLGDERTMTLDGVLPPRTSDDITMRIPPRHSIERDSSQSSPTRSGSFPPESRIQTRYFAQNYHGISEERTTVEGVLPPRTSDDTATRIPHWHSIERDPSQPRASY